MPIVQTKVAVAHGDGIGPEIMNATLRILDAAGANLATTPVDMGKRVYEAGNSAGIASNAWATLQEAKVLLKAPITTPQGGGYKSLNVTLRKSLSLFANVRPVRTYEPYVQSPAEKMDVVIIRENEEDLYAGIEHRQTVDVEQCLKLITRPGCERIVRYAFEYARVHGRQKVTCMSKDNIMKQTDGLFHRVFDEIGAEYPEIEQEHQIIDIGTARMARYPERYDVVVLPNLYGDILSDVAAEIAGSVGLCGSANVGPDCAMFEAIHGSAPDIAGQDRANPSGLINAAVMLLQHLGKGDVARKVHNAWLVTLEDGIHTADVYREGFSNELVGTQAFADAVISRLGEQPEQLPTLPVPSEEASRIEVPPYRRAKAAKQLLGVDLFIDWDGSDPQEIGESLRELAGPHLKLKMITNRGVKVYPGGRDETFCTDHWRCRFVAEDSIVHPVENVYMPVESSSIYQLMERLYQAGWDVIKSENLYSFDGERAFSLGQGE